MGSRNIKKYLFYRILKISKGINNFFTKSSLFTKHVPIFPASIEYQFTFSFPYTCKNYDNINEFGYEKFLPNLFLKLFIFFNETTFNHIFI